MDFKLEEKFFFIYQTDSVYTAYIERGVVRIVVKPIN